MDIKRRFELIKRNTAEIISESELMDLLKKKKNPVVYWGTTPTGKPHIGYFLPMLKIADLLKAGFKVKILLADLHAALDNTPWAILDKRYDYYKKAIPLMMEAIGLNTKNLSFIKGSEFQLKPEYMYDVLQASSHLSVRDAHRAASEVVKMGDNPKLSGLIYPIMQAIDEQYLGADAQLGGMDQRKIFVLSREVLPKIGFESRIEIMHPMIQGLIGKKMSASDEKGKVDLMDDEITVKRKLNNAEMISGNTDNGVMAFLKYVVMVMKQDSKKTFIVKRDKKFGGDLKYKTYGQVERDFISKKLHPLDLKNAVADEINVLLKVFRKNKNILDKLAKDAYD